jgi:hypothetical protein
MDGQSGAYGFRLIFPEGAGELRDLVPLDSAAPEVAVRWRLAETHRTFEHVDDGRVSMGARGASSFHVVREPPSITFDLVAPPEPNALVHPLGTVPLSVLARWRGDVTLHAGAFITPAGAWAVAGERGIGKSTTLALLGGRGYPIMADDLLAILGGSVWAGPRCVDLRPDAAARMTTSRNLGVFGGRPRYRVSTPPGPDRAPLRGMFLLDWDDGSEVTVTRLTPGEHLRWLYGLEYIGLMGPVEPDQILKLLEAPAWRVTRPRTWSVSEDVIERMLESAQAASS